MNYKSSSNDNPYSQTSDTIFNDPSQRNKVKIEDEEEFEIDSSIFFFIEECLSKYNQAELIKVLEDFEIASKIMSLHYISTFNETEVPLMLVNLLTSQNINISYTVSRIICRLITPKAPEYAENLCNNGFLSQCFYIFSQKTIDPSLIYVIIISLSNLASISSAMCSLILSNIHVDILLFYVQSKILDECSYNELLRLLVILSYNNTDELFTSQLIELTQLIFSYFIRSTKIKRYRILQLVFIFSNYSQFYDDFLTDESSFDLLKILASCKKSKEELYFLIPILTNFLKFTDYDFEQQLVEISQLLLSDNARIVKLSCKFIQVYMKENSSINEDLANFIICKLIQIYEDWNLKEKRDILFCIFDIIMFLSQDALIEFIYQNSLFDIIVDALEPSDDELSAYALDSLNLLFKKYLDSIQFLDIKEKFIEDGGTDSLYELMSTSNYDLPKSAERAEMFLNCYILED